MFTNGLTEREGAVDFVNNVSIVLRAAHIKHKMRTHCYILVLGKIYSSFFFEELNEWRSLSVHHLSHNLSYVLMFQSSSLNIFNSSSLKLALAQLFLGCLSALSDLF